MKTEFPVPRVGYEVWWIINPLYPNENWLHAPFGTLEEATGFMSRMMARPEPRAKDAMAYIIQVSRQSMGVQYNDYT
jgi:hypothetical protein